MKIISNLYLVLCHTAWLFYGRHLIGRLEWRHVILNLAGNSFHCRSRTTSDMACNLVLLSSTSQKIYTWNNLARVADEEQNGPGLWEFAGVSGSNIGENCLLRSSLHQYTNNRPIVKKDNCLFRRYVQKCTHWRKWQKWQLIAKIAKL